MNRVGEFVIFLSSSNELRSVRDRIEAITDRTINPLPFERSVRIRIRVDRWERSVPQRVKGERANEMFVAKALSSNLTIVLLQDRLGEGTREELEALLAEPVRGATPSDLPGRPDVALIRFAPTEGADDREIDEIEGFLKLNQEKVIYAGPEVSGDPDSDQSWFVILKVLLGAVLTALEADLEGFNESR
jgi:hypothetical protein